MSRFGVVPVSDIIVRDMTLLDLEVVHAINEENVPAVGQETFDDLRAIFGVCSINLVAEIDGRVRGFCMVMPPGVDYGSPNYLYFCDRHEDFVYLDRVAITADSQGRGIGPMLYREVERRTTAPWFALEVNVQPPNEGSLRFHAREGFVEVDQLETRPGKIVSLMMKPLTT
ncbi:MAG: GNAT family N-acetyltransferase [Actinobacteria bacterium]|nr:GNAT family N-acetyltransferase [Actinomycetota bacterium]